MRKHLVIISIALGFTACTSLNFKTADSRNKAGVKTNSANKKTITKKKNSALSALAKNKNKLSINKDDELFFELSGWDVQKLTESQIYSKTIEKYRQNDLKAVVALTNLLIVKYPLSIFSDNSLYLSGNLAFVEKQYGKSLELYNRLLSHYPMSNKAVSALFAKGVLYKRMNLVQQADATFVAVQTKYPGSPEALRSEIERKLLK